MHSVLAQERPPASLVHPGGIPEAWLTAHGHSWVRVLAAVAFLATCWPPSPFFRRMAACMVYLRELFGTGPFNE